jgi:hypothetical protein
MPAGLGGSGYVAWVLETTKGTYLDPSTAGALFIPIIEESLAYTEDKYLSPQIRQQVIISDAKPSYYHVEGDITLEVDPAFMPHILYCSRHTIVKTGAGPFTYKFTPSAAGATSTAASGAVQRTASIGIIRNGIGFGYAGCTVTGYEFTIEDGVLRVTLNIIGESEATPAALGTPTWSAPNLYGADTKAVFVDTAGAAPAFASPDLNFNGFTWRSNHNAEAQNRITTSRSAQYVSFGETEHSYETELDFTSKTEYDNFKATTFRAIQLRSLHGGATLAAATDGVQLTTYRSFYETYEVGLSGMADLIMAGVTGRGIVQTGGDAYSIEVKSAVSIA